MIDYTAFRDEFEKIATTNWGDKAMKKLHKTLSPHFSPVKYTSKSQPKRINPPPPDQKALVSALNRRNTKVIESRAV